MKKKEAIIILEKQIKRLEQLTDYKNYSWKTYSISLIKDIFGESSVEYQTIIKKPFYKTNRAITDYGISNSYEIDKTYFVDFLNNCIEKIRLNGISRPLTKKSSLINFLSTRSNSIVWTIIITIITAIGSACFLLGKYTSDVKNIELKQQVKELQIQLHKFDN